MTNDRYFVMHYFNLLLIFLLLTAGTAYAQQPVSAEDFSQRGINRFEKNDLEGAIADFTKAIEMNGQQLEFCFYFRGIALYRRGRLDEAIADLSKAITLKQHPRFYDDRGNLLAQRGDFDGALADLTKAIEIDPKYAQAYGDRGIVRLMRGEDTAAEMDFNKCFELDQSLAIHFRRVANQIKRQAVLRAAHQEPTDVEIGKFSFRETPARVLDVPSSPVVSVSTKPLSQTGLRVLGDPSAKDQPVPGTSDQLGTLPTPRRSETTVRGVDYKFTASIKNTGNKTITAVHWAYFFVAQDPKEGFAHVFTTKISILPGKEKTLRDQVPSIVIPTSKSKAPTEHNRSLFKERLVILRLDYSDGSSWQSSGGRR
jgi:tetratricopeptide (TPR) repeat protein